MVEYKWLIYCGDLNQSLVAQRQGLHCRKASHYLNLVDSIGPEIFEILIASPLYFGIMCDDFNSCQSLYNLSNIFSSKISGQEASHSFILGGSGYSFDRGGGGGRRSLIS